MPGRHADGRRERRTSLRRPRIDGRDVQIREVSHVARRERGVPRNGDAGDLSIAYVCRPPGPLSVDCERCSRGRRRRVEIQHAVFQVVWF